MARKGDPNVTRLVVGFLRSYTGLIQEEFGRACRVDQADMSRFEAGKTVPSEAVLQRMAAAAGVPWPVVGQIRRFTAAFLAAVQGTETGLDLELERAVLEPVMMAVRAYLVEDAAAGPARPTPAEARREAAQIWEALAPQPASQRRRLLELTLRASRSWALAERICEASVEEAADQPGEAVELAELALTIAERVEGAEGQRLQGFVWAHIANARRVANDHAGADAAFARAWELWQAGAPSDFPPLPEWRLLDLEASLRRDERRLPAALALLQRALEASQGQPAAAGRILLNKESVLEQMGDAEGAFAALAEAAPFVETAGDPRHVLALRFKTAKNLGSLQRYGEASVLLPEVRELAARLGKKQDLLRLAWLEARVAAGQGRRQEARAGLEKVAREFAACEQPYDAALAMLDLAALDLEEGRTGEVKALALEMMPIFQAQGIGREALAALKLFVDAAQQETATVELARRAMAEVEAARR
jgi:transcriptional regulator with XRE-family HTH domain